MRISKRHIEHFHPKSRIFHVFGGIGRYPMGIWVFFRHFGPCFIDFFPFFPDFWGIFRVSGRVLQVAKTTKNDQKTLKNDQNKAKI